jgi:signal transduction histidine kinase/DNA-binding response OmpR family regulator
MPGKILVAEDDPEAREWLLLVLAQKPDYRLFGAADGVEALDILRAERPDLLITDIVMPRMDGYELVRKLRQDDLTADTPVIFCSASYHEREVRAMAQSLGVFTTLAKPYEAEAVHSLVTEALKARVNVPVQRVASAEPADALADLRATQERLNALVAFSRELFTQVDPDAIARSACHAARDILLAQCAEVVLQKDGGGREHYVASGLTEEALRKLRGAHMYRHLLKSLETGGSALYPMSPTESSSQAAVIPPGEFVSMLGVPVASGSRSYGYLSILNRIALSAFNENDLSVARAIAAQLAVAYENAQRHRALVEEVAHREAVEAEVRRLNQDLEQRVMQRTAELQIANRELEAFTYSVAHDLRAPLRSIDAHVQMMREDHAGSLPGGLVHHIDHIQRGASRMSALIDGLLALSRVSHVEMRRQRISLRELVDRAIEQLQSELHSRVIDWRIGPLPSVACDAGLMQQALVNLIDNAVKYSRTRSRALVEIGLEEGAEPCVFIRDNGVGFDMRYAGKLFGVFQRLHRQDEFEGTGIGLATVRRILERHGGRIWAESTLGEGAVFRFTLQGLGEAGPAASG